MWCYQIVRAGNAASTSRAPDSTHSIRRHIMAKYALVILTYIQEKIKPVLERIVAVSAHREVEKAACNKNIAKLFCLTLNKTLDIDFNKGIITERIVPPVL